MSDYSTNEGKFLESMRLFAAEVAKSRPVDGQALEKLAKFYENPNRLTDPLLALPPSEAKTLRDVQRKVVPELKGHPFFKRVAEIASVRWSREMQELIDAENYLVQVEMGLDILPEIGPHPEAVKIILDARKAVQTGIIPTGSPSGAATKVSQSASDLASILKAFAKENW